MPSEWIYGEQNLLHQYFLKSQPPSFEWEQELGLAAVVVPLAGLPQERLLLSGLPRELLLVVDVEQWFSEPLGQLF